MPLLAKPFVATNGANETGFQIAKQKIEGHLTLHCGKGSRTGLGGRSSTSCSYVFKCGVRVPLAMESAALSANLEFVPPINDRTRKLSLMNRGESNN